MKAVTIRNFALALGVTVVLWACGRSDQPEGDIRRYDVRGIVRGFAPDRTTIDVEHETIPGFMPSMTMPFTARDSGEIAHLHRGDAISFQLAVTDKDAWIANVRRIALEEVRLPKASPTSSPKMAESKRLREGDAMPAFGLTSEAGEKITRETFRGRPLVITFIFTRCAMPSFCPRMSKNFSELQAAIKSSSGPVAQARLLSISIDPQFDRPAILKEYAQHEGADAKIWTFGTGDPPEIEELTRSFGVYRQREGGSMTHGLTTALIDGEGKIIKLWRGNGWTPKEVIESLAQ